MKRAALGVIVLMSGLGTPSMAWEYPHTTFSDSFARGTLAFRGRVKSLSQVRREFTFTVGHAEIAISECFYGSCREGRVAQIEYWPQSIAAPVDECFGYPTPLGIGADLVFIFYRAADAAEPLTLNVCLQKNGASMVYVLSDDPDGWPAHDADGAPNPYGRIFPIYPIPGTRREERFTESSVRAMARKRGAELGQR